MNDFKLTDEEISYLCPHEEENDLDHSHYHGLFVPCAAVLAAQLHPGDGKHEEGTV